MSTIPLRFLDDDAFARLRHLLAGAGFTAEGVCAHAGIASIFDFPSRRAGGRGGDPVQGPVDVLVRLFMDSVSLPAPDVDRELGAEGRGLLEDFGLLVPHPGDATRRVAPVLLYPTEGPWIVSDRAEGYDDPVSGSAFEFAEDAVYPALTDSVRTFLRTLPTPAVDDFLELCSGTGIGALMAAVAGSRRAWAVDITERSTVFARFNARLNGLPAITALRGDLWEPVRGRTFDTIVAHPPYVPAAEAGLIYRDGGEDGEQITRRMLQGLPEHLSRGGVFHCTCLISSRVGASAPQRVRSMIGERSDDFDLVFVRNGSPDLLGHFRTQLVEGDADIAVRVAAHLRRLRELGVETLHFCTLVLRRHGEARTGFTIQVEGGEGVRWHHVAWVLEVGRQATDADAFSRRLLDSRIRRAPSAELDLTYRPGTVGEAAWVPTRGRVKVELPFPSTVAMEVADAGILAEFDGSRTLREHLEALQAQGRVPAEVDPMAFATSFSALVLAGIVESEACPLPGEGGA